MGTKSTFKKDVAIQAILYAAQNVDRKDIHKICKIYISQTKNICPNMEEVLREIPI